MFRLSLDLVDRRFSGTAAIDERRRLGIPDDQPGLQLTTNRCQRGARPAECQVGEDFARQWFAETQTVGTASVPPEMLLPGDLRQACDGNDRAYTFGDLTPDRIRDLYVAVRFTACREQVARLKEQVEHYESEIERLTAE